MCNLCDEAIVNYGKGSIQARMVHSLYHPPTREEVAAKARVDAELYAARRDAEEARDAAPGELAEAVTLLRQVAERDRRCGWCRRWDEHEAGCEFAAFRTRHP